MPQKLIKSLVVLIGLSSCSNDSNGEANIIVEGKKLSSITHIEYSYLYEDLAPTRTHTTTYYFTENNITSISESTFHYWHEDPEKNSTSSTEYTFSYNNDQKLVHVIAQHEHLDYSATQIYTFEYNPENKLKKATYSSGEDFLIEQIYSYADQNVSIKYKRLYYNDDWGELSVVDWYIDPEQINFKSAYRGNLFYNLSDGEPNFNPSSNELFDLGVYTNGNLRYSLINGEIHEEYKYVDIKIPDDFPKIYLEEYLPILSFNSHIYTIAEGTPKSYISYNNHYIDKIIDTNSNNFIVKTYTTTLSADNYPLNIKIDNGSRKIKDITYSYD